MASSWVIGNFYDMLACLFGGITWGSEAVRQISEVDISRGKTMPIYYVYNLVGLCVSSCHHTWALRVSGK